jgi:hypothetical protein
MLRREFRSHLRVCSDNSRRTNFVPKALTNAEEIAVELRALGRPLVWRYGTDGDVPTGTRIRVRRFSCEMVRSHEVHHGADRAVLWLWRSWALSAWLRRSPCPCLSAHEPAEQSGAGELARWRDDARSGVFALAIRHWRGPVCPLRRGNVACGC